MQIITVAPIVRGILKESLTYFSKDKLPTGSVVTVPIKSREVPAIVLSSNEASKSKEELKSSNYAIRKIKNTKPRQIWTPEFLKAVEKTANFHAQKFGETLLTLTPKTILDAYLGDALDEPKISSHKNNSENRAIQNDTVSRLQEYQRLVRESFVHNNSVFICLPTEHDVERVAQILSHGIENYTFVFHSGISKKQTLGRWSKAILEKHAVLVIGTAQYISIPRYFKTIILDEENSHSWKTISRPHIDLRFFVEQYAHENKSSIIFGASILRTETQEKIKSGEIGEFSRITARSLSEAKTAIIDPRIEEKFVREKTGKKDMIFVSKELHTLISEAQEKKEKVLLLVARKGLSPITSCSDCGTIVRCTECDTPLVIHKKEATAGKQETRLFMCHACGLTRSPEENANETCTKCGSWKLQGVGIAIGMVEEKISQLFPKIPLFILDGDHAKTRTQAKKIISQFEKSHGGILITTPMAIPLIEKVEHTAVISIDSLFAIPDIRMPERIFALILALREKTTKTLIVQTRTDDTTLLENALSGNLSQFAKNELTIRKMFNYPPFGTIIKITLHAKRNDIAPEMENLKTYLVEFNPIYPNTISREPKNIFRSYIILKLEKNSWPNKQLLSKLSALPPQFSVEINPDHLL